MAEAALEMALASRLGLGGIVQLWCRGSKAAGCIGRLLSARSGKGLQPQPPGHVQYAIITSVNGPVDEVLVGWTDWGAEINCHGGTTAARAVMGLLGENGFAEISLREWWFGEARAGRIRLPECEAQLRFPHAVTPMQVAVLTGAEKLCRDTSRWQEMLQRKETEKLSGEISCWLNSYKAASHILKRHRLAVAGAPNVGKSTCFNALLSADRAMVSAVAGTTRDAVEDTMTIAGLEVRLIDTAGLLGKAVGADAEAVRRARQRLKGAHLRLLVLDGSRSLGTEDREAVGLCDGLPTLVAINKDDLPRRLDSAELAKTAITDAPFSFSACDSKEVDRLLHLLGEKLWDGCGAVGSAPAVAAFTRRQQERLEEIGRALATRDYDRAGAGLHALTGTDENTREAELEYIGRDFDKEVEERNG